MAPRAARLGSRAHDHVDGLVDAHVHARGRDEKRHHGSCSGERPGGDHAAAYESPEDQHVVRWEGTVRGAGDQRSEVVDDEGPGFPEEPSQQLAERQGQQGSHHDRQPGT